MVMVGAEVFAVLWWGLIAGGAVVEPGSPAACLGHFDAQGGADSAEGSETFLHVHKGGKCGANVSVDALTSPFAEHFDLFRAKHLDELARVGVVGDAPQHQGAAIKRTRLAAPSYNLCPALFICCLGPVGSWKCCCCCWWSNCSCLRGRSRCHHAVRRCCTVSLDPFISSVAFRSLKHIQGPSAHNMLTTLRPPLRTGAPGGSSGLSVEKLNHGCCWVGPF